MMFWKKSLIYCAFLLIPKLSKLPCRTVDSYQINANAGEAFHYQQPRWQSDKSSTTMMCSVEGEPCGEQKDSTIF